MFKKLIGFTALAGVVAVGSGIGCSVTTTTTESDAATTSTATGTTTATGTGTTPKPKDAAAPSCYDDQSAITGFKFTAPKAAQGVCTEAQVDAIIAGCFGTTGSADKCKAATEGANVACDDCITGKVDGPFPAFVTIDDQGNGYIGVAVCAGLVLNKADCGPKLLTAASCVASACSTCETAGEEACETEAAAGACKDALAAVGTCNTDLTNGAAQTDPICKGADAVASLKKVANYLCGGASADAGGGG